MVNDTISNMLTCIRNACLVKSQTVSIPFTKLSQNISRILEKEGFIESFQISPSGEILLRLKYIGNEKIPCITNLRRISKPGLRIYVNKKEIPRVLGGMGIVILSTSQGIMTDSEARSCNIGGELLCSIW
uniref:Small ribosomal subunit protein uS8c n=1 Tax=Neglectella solitaria TaxID=120749 RepID=C7BEE3_NEGSO|nr:ribosomal protein S8 [Neglectella solitaria]